MTKKISLPRIKRVKRHTKSGKRNLNFLSLRPEKWKIMIRSREPERTGKVEEWPDTAGRKPNLREKREVETSRTIRPKLLKRNSKQDSSTRANPLKWLAKEEREARLARQRADTKKDDCLFTHSYTIYIVSDLILSYILIVHPVYKFI